MHLLFVENIKGLVHYKISHLFLAEHAIENFNYSRKISLFFRIIEKNPPKNYEKKTAIIIFLPGINQTIPAPEKVISSEENKYVPG